MSMLPLPPSLLPSLLRTIPRIPLQWRLQLALLLQLLVLLVLLGSCACPLLLSFATHGYQRLEEGFVCDLSYTHPSFACEDRGTPYHHQGRHRWRGGSGRGGGGGRSGGGGEVTDNYVPWGLWCEDDVSSLAAALGGEASEGGREGGEGGGKDVLLLLLLWWWLPWSPCWLR